MSSLTISKNGQVTLPIQFRRILQLKSGDILEAELRGETIVLRPKVLLQTQTKERLLALLEKNWQKNRNISEKETEEAVQEAVLAVRTENRD